MLAFYLQLELRDNAGSAVLMGFIPVGTKSTFDL